MNTNKPKNEIAARHAAHRAREEAAAERKYNYKCMQRDPQLRRVLKSEIESFGFKPSRAPFGPSINHRLWA